MEHRSTGQTRSRITCRTNPSFIDGMIQAFDIGAVMCALGSYEDDTEALIDDWYAVGDDFWQAVVRFDDEHDCRMLSSLKFQQYVTARN